MPALTGKKLRQYLKNRKVAVVGLGRSGVAAALCLKTLGAKVFISESEPRSKALPGLPGFLRALPSEFGGHSRRVLDNDLIVVSPGVEWNQPLLRRAREKGIPVWAELELGCRLTRFRSLVAVTGTNGKTTTTAWIGDMFRRAGRSVLVAGNIGSPLCDHVFDRKKYSAAVLEVSSYQLEGTDIFHPSVSLVLNVTPDHLHRHKTMAGYARAKERIFRNQGAGQFVVLNADDPWCRGMARRARARKLWFSVKRKTGRGAFLDRASDQIELKWGALKSARFGRPRHLPGLHNVENACAAVAAARAAGVPARAIQSSLDGFKGVPHRLESVAVVRGVRYVNDSKGTNVDSTLRALEAVSGPVWLILGGEDKGSPYAPLKNLVREKVKGVFLIGEAAAKIRRELRGTTRFIPSKTLSRAVSGASQDAAAGDTVLLSPACASFDQFRNFEDRGDRFKALVRALKKS